MRLSKARVGAVRRAACAEPICGGSLPSTPRLRRRRSSGRVRWTRELLRRDHEGSQERGAFASASWGELAVHDQAGACAGGREGCRPYPRPARRSVGVFASAGPGGRLPSPPRPKLERAAGGSPSLGARERWLPASGSSPENWLSASGFWLKNWLSGAGFPLERGLPGFHARLDGRVAVPAELARVVVVPHAMGQ